MDFEQKIRRGKYIQNLQNIIELETGIKPQLKEIEKHVGIPGEIKHGAPPWLKQPQYQRDIIKN
jgi:hypothetical protein